jgi:hypothetical protein
MKFFKNYLSLTILSLCSAVNAASSSAPIVETYPLTNSADFLREFKYVGVENYPKLSTNIPNSNNRYYLVSNNYLTIVNRDNTNDISGAYYLDNQIPLDTSFSITADAHIDHSINVGAGPYLSMDIGIVCVVRNKDKSVNLLKSINNRFYSVLSRTELSGVTMNRANASFYNPQEKEVYSPSDVGDNISLKISFDASSKTISSYYKLPGSSDYSKSLLTYKISKLSGAGKYALPIVGGGIYQQNPGFAVSEGQMTIKNMVISFPNSGIQITTQPSSQSVGLKKVVKFSVTATGEALKYQWYKDNVAIPRATKSVFIISKASYSSVASYTVKITNSVDAVGVTSDPARLTIQ